MKKGMKKYKINTQGRECICCRLFKRWGDFYKGFSENKTGINECKFCKKEKSKKKYIENKEKINKDRKIARKVKLLHDVRYKLRVLLDEFYYRNDNIKNNLKLFNGKNIKRNRVDVMVSKKDFFIHTIGINEEIINEVYRQKAGAHQGSGDINLRNFLNKKYD